MITIINEKEMKEYYVKETNAYVFDDDVTFLCNINVEANIIALDINALNIKALDIKTLDITAHNITADNIDTGDIKANDICANNIEAYNINARNINAWNIDASDIKALDINVNGKISYFSVCYAIKGIRCQSIEGRRHNHHHFALDNGIVLCLKKRRSKNKSSK